MDLVQVLWAVLAILVFGSVGSYILNFNTLQLPGRVRQRIKELPPGSMGWPLIGETLLLKKALSASTPFAFFQERISKKLMGSFALIALHGDTHKRMRRLQQPFLRPDKLKTFMSTLEGLIIANLEECEKKGTFSGHAMCRQTTFDIIAKLMMDVDRGPESDAIFRDFDFWRMGLSFSILPIEIPGSAFSKGVQARARMGAVIENICRKRQQEGTVGTHSDLIDTLLTEDESDGGPPLTYQQVNDLVFTALAAGMDTLSTVLCFAMMYLHENSDVLDKLRKENLDLLKKVEANKPLAWADLKSLNYTNKVINEVLRLTSPAGFAYRVAVNDTKLLGFFIPSGVRTQIAIMAIHRDPRNYEEPDKFDPDRWQEDKPAGKGLTFLPFGYGARSCIGMELARLEIVLFLHHLVCKYKWETTEHIKTNYFPLPSLTNGFPIRLSRFATT